MSKQAVFTMKLEPELRAEFMAEAESSHRPASQILRELMRDFVQRQRDSREYRSEERRVGKECCVECISRWSPYH